MDTHRSSAESTDRSDDEAQAVSATRRELIADLKQHLSAELHEMTGGAVTLANGHDGPTLTLLIDRKALTPDEDRLLMALLSDVRTRRTKEALAGGIAPSPSGPSGSGLG